MRIAIVVVCVAPFSRFSCGDLCSASRPARHWDYHCSSMAGSVDGGGGEELMASCLRKRAKLSSARRRFVSS